MAKKPIASGSPARKPQCDGALRTSKGTPAKFLGYVEAPDEKAAIEAAVKEFKIAPALRDRIVAQRDL
jgi:hypothetical protein